MAKQLAQLLAGSDLHELQEIVPPMAGDGPSENTRKRYDALGGRLLELKAALAEAPVQADTRRARAGADDDDQARRGERSRRAAEVRPAIRRPGWPRRSRTSEGTNRHRLPSRLWLRAPQAVLSEPQVDRRATKRASVENGDVRISRRIQRKPVEGACAAKRLAPCLVSEEQARSGVERAKKRTMAGRKPTPR